MIGDAFNPKPKKSGKPKKPSGFGSAFEAPPKPKPADKRPPSER